MQVIKSKNSFFKLIKFPISAGKFVKLFSLKYSICKLVKLPISFGKFVNLLL